MWNYTDVNHQQCKGAFGEVLCNIYSMLTVLEIHKNPGNFFIKKKYIIIIRKAADFLLLGSEK